MSTFTQIIYQIVFATKNRETTLAKDNRYNLFKYFSGVLANNKCHVYCINGMDDHVHIVTHIHPSVALAQVVKDLKVASSGMIRQNGLFEGFHGWQDGYGAFTYSIKEKPRLINYVENQEEHHRRTTYLEEYIELLNEHGVEFDMKYLQ